jgi:glycosyltransferase involved in cell wall biosynthesis
MNEIKTLYIMLGTDNSGGAERFSAYLAEYWLQIDSNNVVMVVVVKEGDGSCLKFFDKLDSKRLIINKMKFKRLLNFGIWLLLRYNYFFKEKSIIFTTLALMTFVFSIRNRLIPESGNRIFISRESNEPSRRYGGIKLLLWKIVYKLYYGQDRLIFQTESMLNSFLKINSKYESRCLVISNPVKEVIIDYKERIDDNKNAVKIYKFLHVGRFVKIKNQIFILYAFAKLPINILERCELTFIGDGQELEMVKRKCAQLNLSNVKFLGEVDAVDFYSSHDCLLLASSSEGFPNVVLEGMTNGIKHIISTPCVNDRNYLNIVDVVPLLERQWISALIDAVKFQPDYSLEYSNFIKENHSIHKFHECLRKIL